MAILQIDRLNQQVFQVDNAEGSNALRWVVVIDGPTDPTSSAITTIELPHHEVHEGSYYRAGMNYTLSNGQVAGFALTTPNTTKWAHITWELNCSADGTFTVLEDVTSFSGGGTITPLAHNRNIVSPSGAVCMRGNTAADLITPTGGGTIINSVLSTGKGSSVSRASGAEIVLKQNSKYLFQYTNGTSVNIVDLAFEWYEHNNIA